MKVSEAIVRELDRQGLADALVRAPIRRARASTGSDPGGGRRRDTVSKAVKLMDLTLRPTVIAGDRGLRRAAALTRSPKCVAAFTA